MQVATLDIHDWIAQLAPHQRVLDVGSGAGSFPASAYQCAIVTLDEDPAVRPSVCGGADRLPFRAGSFDLVVCHHSLEHITAVDQALTEIARVLAPGGRCFFSMPHGYGLCDAVYRFVFEGGGHVNRFRRPEIVRRIEQRAGVRLVCWQKLYSSFAYLRRLIDLLNANPPGLAPRLVALGRLPRSMLGFAQYALYVGTRIADAALGSDLAVYGWAFFFERAEGTPAVEQPGYVNVCLYCGVGQAAAGHPRVTRVRCQCAACGRLYPYTRPFGKTL
jgi:SAM-dependent methyltransferase